MAKKKQPRAVETLANTPPADAKPAVTVATGEDTQVVTCRTRTIKTLEAALAAAEVDEKTWEVERWVANKWDMGFKQNAQSVGALELWQVKVWLRRRCPKEVAIAALIQELADNSPIVLKLRRKRRRKQQPRRMFELCIMDPHLGLQCFTPGSDHSWGLEDCADVCMWAVNSLLELAKAYGPIESIVFPFGNDFLHSDNVFHTTTAGTGQPEAISWHHTYRAGIHLAIEMVDAMKAVAPVQVYQVPGNHDRQSTYTLGEVLWAYYRNDKNVTVDSSASPYKFHRYGTNLIGYEHGHSVKAGTLAALMANERRADWAETSYREWHIGDQHRKGSAKPSMMEEQGVSVEYMPGLTPPNEWHRLKGFNWQKRGALGFVWDFSTGPTARVQVNLNSYTGKPTGK